MPGALPWHCEIESPRKIVCRSFPRIYYERAKPRNRLLKCSTLLRSWMRTSANGRMERPRERLLERFPSFPLPPKAIE
jgi:hypothetical protein